MMWKNIPVSWHHQLHTLTVRIFASKLCNCLTKTSLDFFCFLDNDPPLCNTAETKATQVQQKCNILSQPLLQQLAHRPVLPSLVHVLMLLHHDRVSCWHVYNIPGREWQQQGSLEEKLDLLLSNLRTQLDFVLLCRLVKNWCEKSLFICTRRGDIGGDPVGPIRRFADRVGVGDGIRDQWLLDGSQEKSSVRMRKLIQIPVVSHIQLHTDFHFWNTINLP